MSVATRNPFALLDDDGSRPSSPPPAKPAAAAPSAAPRGGAAAAKPKGGPAARGGKYYQRGGAPTAKTGAGNLNQNGVDETPADGQRKEPRRGGRGGSRGARGGSAGGRGRAFDKHSQTGKTDSDKKIHQSWGGDDGPGELKNEEAATQDAAADAAANWGGEATTTTGDAWTADAAEGDAKAPAAEDPIKEERRLRREREAREQEEEDALLTLDQYLAQQKENDLVPKLEQRQVNDGAEWTDVVPLQKVEEDAYFAGKSKAAPKARAKKEEKVYLEIDARFDRPQRGAPRGGGRGGDRGGDRGGERRGGRGGRGGPSRGRGGANTSSHQPAVNVDDETAFPSLS